MELKYKSIPANVKHSMDSGIMRMLSSPSFSKTHFSKALPIKKKTPKVSSLITLPLFNLGLSDLIKTKSLENAKHIGWRSLIGDSAGVYALADVHTPPKKDPVFAQVNTGPFVNGLSSALKILKKQLSRDNSKVQYRPIVLSIPAIYVIALALTNNKNSIIKVVPLEPAPSFLSANALMSKQEFINAILPIAENAQHSYNELV